MEELQFKTSSYPSTHQAHVKGNKVYSITPVKDKHHLTFEGKGPRGKYQSLGMHDSIEKAMSAAKAHHGSNQHSEETDEQFGDGFGKKLNKLVGEASKGKGKLKDSDINGRQISEEGFNKLMSHVKGHEKQLYHNTIGKETEHHKVGPHKIHKDIATSGFEPTRIKAGEHVHVLGATEHDTPTGKESHLIVKHGDKVHRIVHHSKVVKDSVKPIDSQHSEESDEQFWEETQFVEYETGTIHNNRDTDKFHAIAKQHGAVPHKSDNKFKVPKAKLLAMSAALRKHGLHSGHHYSVDGDVHEPSHFSEETETPIDYEALVAQGPVGTQRW